MQVFSISCLHVSSGINADELYENFCQPKIKVGSEWVTKGQNVDQAHNAVAGIARATFEKQFRYLVAKCNDTLVDPSMRKYVCTVRWPS